MSTRVLFTCWPFPGHVLPQLGVASALRDRGADVTFYTGASAASTIEQAGFAVIPFERLDEERARRNVDELERRDPRRLPNPAQARRIFRDWLVETIPDQVADLEPVLRDWQPDVIVADAAFWAPVVVFWEKVPVPVALFPNFMGTLIPGPDVPPWGLGLAPPRRPTTRALSRWGVRASEWVGRGLPRRVDEMHAEHGLTPMGGSVNRFIAGLPLCLVGSLRELDYGRHDLPPTVHYVGDCTWHPPEQPGDSGWLDDVPRVRPWVHVTEGTLHSGDPFISRSAAQGLADAPMEVIITTGGRDPRDLDLGPRAGNIHLTGWTNHETLLPRCAVVVTAGGASTIVTALRAGVPLVVVPTTWDKPDNARRVADAGVGVRLSPRRCTPSGLRAAVEQVLGDPRFREQARRVAERLAEAPGASGAAALLEEIALPARVVEQGPSR